MATNKSNFSKIPDQTENKANSLFSNIKERLTGMMGSKDKTQAQKPEQKSEGVVPFRRRMPVKRESLNSENARCHSKPARYVRGIEAAALFELSDRERASMMPAEEPAAPAAVGYTGAVGFLYRHRKALIAACLVFALVFGGVQYLLGLYNKEDLFISDKDQAGNITISDRLTTSDEHADKVKYILIVGVDDSSLLTDCIWIMCFDNEAHEMNVMQIPRDTYVGDDSSWPHKINAVYASPKTVRWCEKCEVSPTSSEISGSRHTVCASRLTSKKESNISALIRVINNRLGLPIDHFVIFNFRGFAKIIDAMGGVDIHLDYTVKDPAIHLEPGDHHLTGWPAVDFMRSRKGFANGDIGRVNNQRILIDALMQKALDMDLSAMLDVVVKCANAECFQTDLSIAQMKDIAVAGRQMSVDKLNMVTMPGYDHWPDRSRPSYYVCSEAKTVEILNQYLLPYGLPDGEMASANTVNFPVPDDSAPIPGQTTSTEETSTTEDTTTSTEETTTTTEPTTTTTEEPPETTTQRTTTTTRKTTTTKKTTTTTKKTTTTSKTTTSSTTASTTASTTESTTASTTASTTESTTTSTTTTTTTTQTPTTPPTQDNTEEMGPAVG